MSLLSNAWWKGSDGEEGGMPRSQTADVRFHDIASSAVMGQCSNPRCRSGWFHMFRKRKRPVFEGGWTCSPNCTEARLQLSVRRELDGWQQIEQTHRHRIPLGLLMLEKGWITSQQLRRAIEAQRGSRNLRIGEWLVAQGATNEVQIARGVSLQWGCPVLSVSNSGMAGTSEVMPRLFVEAFGALPLKVPSGRIVYLGFEQSLDAALALSVERMSGIRVESGIIPSSVYADAVDRLRNQAFPALQLAETASDLAAAHVLARSIERARPISSRLVRVHEWLWLRMVLQSPSGALPISSCISDVVCRIGAL